MIAIPETYRDAIATCCVLDRGPYANPHLQVGDLVVMEGSVGDRFLQLNSKRDFMIEDKYILGKIIRKKVYPLGNTILFERDLSDEVSGGIVVSSSQFQRQSLWGWPRRHGLLRPGQRRKINDVKLDVRTRLTMWEPHMKELYLEDSYYLIVKESDLLCAEWNS